MENISFRIITTLIVAASFGAAQKAHGSLFSSFNLEQGVSYYIPGNSPVITPVNDSTVPFDASVSLDSGQGSNIKSTYDVYDSGSAAGFSITTSATIAALSSSVAEVTNPNTNNDYTVFEFSQPVSYNLELASGSTNAASISLSVQPNFPGGSTINISQSGNSAQYDLSGVLKAGTPYFLDEGWDISNTGAPPEPVNVSGTESIVFTFTPVPEPSAVVLLPALAAATRRRPGRRRKS
jgi:hypothetical protein